MQLASILIRLQLPDAVVDVRRSRPSRDPDRRLRLRSAHHRGTCAGAAGRVDVREIDASFPHPDSRRRWTMRLVRLRACPTDATVMIDGLAFGAMPLVLEREGSRLRLVALVHHPLAAESGLDRQTAARLEASERRALTTARSVVVTSHATAAALARVRRHARSRPRGRARNRSRAAGEGIRLADRAVALCGDARAAQGPRDAVSGARRVAGAELAADLHRQPRTRSGDGRAAARVAARRAARGPGDAGRRDGRAGARALNTTRADLFVLPTLLRGLRNGRGRSARAWPAGDQHGDRRDRGTARVSTADPHQVRSRHRTRPRAGPVSWCRRETWRRWRLRSRR